MKASTALSFLALLACTISIAGADWPQILGPARDGVSAEDNLASAWPKDGPRVVWRRAIGEGFAGPVVASGTLILFHRVNDREVVEALGARDGKPIWRHDDPATYRDDFGFDPGPRATPTISSNRVFTFGADGLLTCLSLADGRKLWAVDCRKEFGAVKGFFGLACSPLAVQGMLVVNVGGSGGSVVSFDQESGKVQWKTLEDEPSYSSPVASRLGGQSIVLALTRGRFVGLETLTGKLLFEHPFRPPVSASVTGASPLLLGDAIFISAAYDLGAILLRPSAGKVQTLWASDDKMSLQFTTAVLRDNCLYGLHGRHDFPGGTELRCVEWRSGKVRWQKAGLGGANLIRAGGSLLLLSESGELIRINATPDGYAELGRAQIVGKGVRAYPALASGMFYARDKGNLVCVDLR